jgi:DNA-binding CsgD family transcriptional regulator
MLDRFSATINRIYEASSGACPWEDALVAIEDLTGCAGAVVDLVPKLNGIPRKTLAGSFTAENCAEYASSYQAICPRIRYAIEHQTGSTHYDYLFMTEFEMDRDPVYHWFGTHNLRYYLAGAVADTPSYLAYVSLQRTRKQGHASAQDIELFDLLKPHLSRAASLADQLGTLQSFARFSSAMFEASPNGLFALDGNGTILFANSRAEACLRAGDGLRSSGGRLTAALESEQAALDRLIRDAAAIDMPGGGGWTRASRLNGGPPYAIFIAPLKIQDEELLAQSVKVLAIVHDTGEQRQADAAMLAGVYGLTDAESRLASALSGGHSIESAAAKLGVQVTTARSQLKSVFRKVGVNRQQDLVRLLASLRASQ